MSGIEKVVAALLPGGVNGSSADDCKDLANKLLASGKCEDAVWLYTLGLQKRPSCHILLSNRSAANAKLGRFDLALSDADDCVRSKPDWGKGHGRRGAALEGLGRLKEALIAFEKAASIDQTNAAAAAALDSLKQRIDDKGTSAEQTMTDAGSSSEAPKKENQSTNSVGDILKPVPELKPAEPEDPEVVAAAAAAAKAAAAAETAALAEKAKQRGNKAFAGGNFEDAIQHFTEAINLDKNNHVLFSNRSGAYASVNQFQSALADAQKCINLASGWAKGYGRRAAALVGLGRRAQAIDSYRQGLALEPDNATLVAGLAGLVGPAGDGEGGAAPAGGDGGGSVAVKEEAGGEVKAKEEVKKEEVKEEAKAVLNEEEEEMLLSFLSEATDIERRQQVERILKFRLNPFEVLQIKPEAGTGEELKGAYRRVSLAVHPDKCKHPRAEEAFELCKKALAELEDADKQPFYVEVMRTAREEAERELRKRKKKDRDEMVARKKLRTEDVDKLRATMLGGLLPKSRKGEPDKVKEKEKEKEEFGNADDDEFTVEDEITLAESTREAAHRILTQLEKRRSRAEKVFVENDKRCKLQVQDMKEKNQHEEKVEEEWSRDRLDRIESWRDFTKGNKKLSGIKKPKPHITEKGVSVLPPTMGGIRSSKEEDDLLKDFMSDV